MFTPHLSRSLSSSESLTQGYMSFYGYSWHLNAFTMTTDHQNRSVHNHQVAGRSSWSAAWRVDQNPHRPSECRRWWPPPQRHRCRWSTRTHQRYLRKTGWKLESHLQVPPEKNQVATLTTLLLFFFGCRGDVTMESTISWEFEKPSPIIPFNMCDGVKIRSTCPTAHSLKRPWHHLRGRTPRCSSRSFCPNLICFLHGKLLSSQKTMWWFWSWEEILNLIHLF